MVKQTVLCATVVQFCPLLHVALEMRTPQNVAGVFHTEWPKVIQAVSTLYTKTCTLVNVSFGFSTLEDGTDRLPRKVSRKLTTTRCVIPRKSAVLLMYTVNFFTAY